VINEHDIEAFMEMNEAPTRMSNLVQIEGGRAIAARDVQAAFASETETLMLECADMAGFFVVVWDDEGARASVMYRGKRCPYGPTMIKDMITSALHDADNAT
jgi:hypothetical protein